MNRRELFAAATGALAALAGWKTKPAPRYLVDELTGIRMRLVSDCCWPVKELPIAEFEVLYPRTPDLPQLEWFWEQHRANEVFLSGRQW